MGQRAILVMRSVTALRRSLSKIRRIVLAGLVVVSCSQVCSAQGLMIPGVGAKNRSFGGAATGNAIDAPGALFFNPAAMSKLAGNEIVIGVEVPFTRETVTSTGFGSSGTTRADVGIFPLSTTSIVFRPESQPHVTYGLGMFSAGGLFTNYPGDASNPVLQPRPPNGAGAGPLFSLLSLLQFVPAASVQVTDNLSFGAGPVVTLATLQLGPASLAPPDDANGDGFFTYPPATGTHPHYGLGFQLGAYYTADSGFNFGVSYKSTNWLETIEVNSQDELGGARELQFQLDLPRVYSIGMSYEGIPCWLFAADVRYVDYDNVDTLSNSGFNPDGSVRGVGWESVWSLSLGLQKQLSQTSSFRAGWFMTENPIPDENAAFNVGAPAYYKHILSSGLSFQLTPAVTTNIAYYYAPVSKISGPIQLPTGPAPGTRVTNAVSSHAILFSMAFKY